MFGVQGAAGVSASNEVLVGYMIGADFNVTTDQSIAITAGYRVTKITVTNASVNMTTAAGGFYTGAAKTGTQIVASTQVYSALTSPTITLNCTIAAVVSGLTAVIFSLTTGQGAPATADIRVYGISGSLS